MLARLLNGSRSINFHRAWATGSEYTSSNPADAKKAFQLSAVRACVRLRASLVSQMGLTAYRTDSSGTDLVIPRQPLLVSNPSTTVVRSIWLAQMMISRDLWGNAHGIVAARDAAAYPTAVEWLHPDDVHTSQDAYGAPLQIRVKGQAVAPHDIITIPSLYTLPGTPIGQAPLEATGLTEVSKLAQEFGRDWFKNGAVPSMILYSDDELTDSDAEAIRNRIMASWRGRRPAVIGTGLKAEPVKIDKNSAQFLETMRHVQVDICQVFGVQPEMIGIGVTGQAITYANKDQRMQDYLVTGLNADLVVIQDVLTGQLPRPQYVKLNTAAILRSDISTRYNTYLTAAQIEQITGEPLLSVDEMRALEERAPNPKVTPEPDPTGEVTA